MKRVNRIQKLRLEKGLTQHELSLLMGLSAATISYYERGAKTPSLPNALKLAKVLDTTIENLFPLKKIKTKSEVKQNV